MKFKKGCFLYVLLLCCCMGMLPSCNNENPSAFDKTVPKETATQQPPYIPALMNDSGYTPVDRSPMDMAYFPADYPTLRMNGINTGSPLARVIYSRPQKNGRTIFGNTEKNTCQYGKEWRLGANEATEIEFFTTARIQNQKLPAGRYIIYCIPYPEKWVIVFNSELFTWGLHINPEKDIARFELPVTHTTNTIEIFTMEFLPATKGANLLMAWDHNRTELPISF